MLPCKDLRGERERERECLSLGEMERVTVWMCFLNLQGLTAGSEVDLNLCLRKNKLRQFFFSLLGENFVVESINIV